MDFNQNQPPMGQFAGQPMHDEMDEEIIEETSHVLEVWDEDEFPQRGEDFLPLAVSIGLDHDGEDNAVLLILESIDSTYHVRLHKEELKAIAQRLVEATKDL